MSSPTQGRRTHQMLLNHLESLHQAGVLQLPKGRAAHAPPKTSINVNSPATPESRAPASTQHNSSTAPVPPQPATSATSLCTTAGKDGVSGGLEVIQSGCRLTLQQQVEGLQSLRDSIAACTRCPVLVQNRSQTVFGVGNPQARVVFLGEAPGADEDRQGEPFVGRAGQLLTKMIEACTLKREDVYILNILKCRPPDNRTPLPDEVESCRPFFQRQLELLHPEFICCLGAVAAQSLLQTNVPVGKLRGRLHAYQSAKVVVTYHPAYLLRSPDQKRAAWEDLKMLMREMQIEVPDKW